MEREHQPSEPLPPVPDECYPLGAKPLRPTLIESPPNLDEALRNAARLLRAAETETDRGLMERLEKLADSWIGLASLLTQRDAA